MPETTTAPVVGDTPAGVLVGSDPVPVQTREPDPEPSYFTAEDLEKARKQEKDKLYDRLESQKSALAAMQEEVALLKKEREERTSAEQRAREEAEEAARRKAEEEMDVRSLLETKEAEWKAALEEERLERERALAMLEQEKRFSEINEYRLRRIEEERDNIIPQLLDLVTGNTPEEIEASIAGLRDRSADILDSAQQALQVSRAAMPGARVTAPPAGPLDNETAQRMPTPDEIRNMPMNEYAKYRQRLLGSAGNERRGLFG